MPQPPDRANQNERREVLRAALLREISRRIAQGEALVEGEWIPAHRLRKVLRAGRFTATRRLLEAFALQALIVLFGLSLMFLPLLLL